MVFMKTKVTLYIMILGNNPTWEDRVYNLVDGNRVWVVQNIDERQQVANFRVAGYDVNMLDGNTQLKVFFYTWLSMERAEGGYVIGNTY